MVPLTLVSCCAAVGQIQVLDIQLGVCLENPHIIAPPSIYRDFSNRACRHFCSIVDQDMGFAEFGLDFREQRLDARFVRDIGRLSDKGD